MGKFTGYACMIDQVSGDNPASGGVFSSALIRSGLRFGSRNSYEYSWMSIKSAVIQAQEEVRSDRFSTQEPTYLLSPSGMKMTSPFALTNKVSRSQW